MANVIFKIGTSEQYNLLDTKDSSTLYWLMDTKQVYKGDVLFAVGADATLTASGLMSPDDKKKIDAITEVQGISLLTNADDSIKIVDGMEGEKKISVQLSDNEGHNAIKLEGDGLLVDEVSYSLIKKTEDADGYAAVYQLQETKNGTTTDVGEPINIPKDVFVKSGSLKIASAPEDFDGAQVGDPYIELVLSDENSTVIKIPCKELIDSSAYVIGEMKGTNGTAKIFNESDGGGAQFVHTDGSKSFVGVHDGTQIKGVNNLAAQIYAVDAESLGSRINVFQDKITYINKTANSDHPSYDDAEYELVVKKDLAELEKRLQEMGGVIEWSNIGELTTEQVDQAVTTIANSLSDYAAITVGEGQITAQIKADQGEVDINDAFGVKLMQTLSKYRKKFYSLCVKDKPESKIDLSGDHINLLDMLAFVRNSGLQANKLKELAGKTLDIVFTDAGYKDHDYKMTFSMAASEAA